MNFKCLKDNTATYVSYINYFVDAQVRVGHGFLTIWKIGVVRNFKSNLETSI